MFAIGYLLCLLALDLAFAAPAEVPSAAAFYVRGLPGLAQNAAQPLSIFAGHLSSDPHIDQASPTDITPHLYFVLIKNRRTADRQRVMFWFNGGPGCSSFDGLMMENGPWRFDDQGKLTLQEGGWEEYTTMVYIDQPAGTGYSYTSTDKYVHSLNDASEQFLTFLRNFYRVFPEYANVDTYFGGESYAGQYIPYFANAVLDSNLHIPLRGIAIGNGWIDAKRQYPSYLAYAVKHGLIEDQSDAWKESKSATDECLDEINKITSPEPISTAKCEGLLNHFLESNKKGKDGETMCINMYDVRLLDTSPSCGMNWPVEIRNVTTYLDRPDVVNALHADAHPGAWVECKGSVHTQFREKESNSSITLLPRLLAKIPVLIFAGDQDLICNYVGMEAMLQALTWNGETGLGTVQTQSWSVNGNPAGTWVESRNLTYAKVFNASHMVAYDVPNVAHDMILRFMGANFTAILDAEGSAKIPSSLGSMAKPMPSATLAEEPKEPEASSIISKMSNSGSTFVIVLAVLVGAGGLLCWRLRRRRVQLPESGTEEESIPLATNGENRYPSRKGKERATESTEEIFGVGNLSEDDEEYRSDSSKDKRS